MAVVSNRCGSSTSGGHGPMARSERTMSAAPTLASSSLPSAALTFPCSSAARVAITYLDDVNPGCAQALDPSAAGPTSHLELTPCCCRQRWRPGVPAWVAPRELLQRAAAGHLRQLRREGRGPHQRAGPGVAQLHPRRGRCERLRAALREGGRHPARAGSAHALRPPVAAARSRPAGSSQSTPGVS